MSLPSVLPAADIVRNYFHVRVTKKNGNILYKIDLTEEKLNDIADKYEGNIPFMMQNTWIYPLRDIDTIGITMTLNDSRAIQQNERQKRGFVRISGSTGSIENFVYEKGEPVTEEFITKPPNNTNETTDDTNETTNDEFYQNKEPGSVYVNKTKDIFIVHGHDDLSKLQLARILEQAGLKGRILHEEPNEGKTLIEKFEGQSDDSAYAFILLTPDDIGRAEKEEGTKKRARQNVILEMGYFMGLLKRKNVCILKKGDIEIPSDIYGILPYSYTKDVNERKSEILSELENAGFKISLT